MKYKKIDSGFTLAELLISLVILGVIATFTIPKVLSSQQSSQYSSIAKEAAGMISGAYQAYKQSNSITSGMVPADLSPYINYVSVDTASTPMDNEYSLGTHNCNNARPCLHLHNGAVLYLDSDSFGGTASTNLILFDLDPDGKVTDGTTNGPGKAMEFGLYTTGRLIDHSGALPGSATSSGAYNANAGRVPPWFSWN